MGSLFGKKKKTDPVLEQIAEELDERLKEHDSDKCRLKYKRLVRCFEEALSSGQLSDAQQSYYYDRIHAYREILTERHLL